MNEVCARKKPWDAAGRLNEVSRRDGDSDGFEEQSIYDPLGRRVRVVYTPYNNSAAGNHEQHWAVL
jgi:hypothetical protein